MEEDEYEEEEEIEYVKDEKHDGGNQFISQIMDLISENNPFKKKED